MLKILEISPGSHSFLCCLQVADRSYRLASSSQFP